ATVRNYQSAAGNFEQAHNYAEAAKLYGLAASVADTESNKADMYRRQGTAYLRAEEYTKASDAYLKALNGDIDDRGRIYMALAEANFYNNDFRDALKYVKEARKFENQRRNAAS